LGNIINIERNSLKITSDGFSFREVILRKDNKSFVITGGIGNSNIQLEVGGVEKSWGSKIEISEVE